MSKINSFELEVLAKEKLPTDIYAYYAGGENDEITLRENRLVYDEIKLSPKVLDNTGSRNLSTTVREQSIAAPIIIAPMGFQGAATDDGEIATVRTAQASKTIMTLSTKSISNGCAWPLTSRLEKSLVVR